LRLLGIGIGVVVLYNAGLALTQLGVLGQANFRGDFEHKNSLAKMMTLAAAVFLCLAGERRGRLIAIMMAAVSFGLVVISGSATGLVVVLTLAAVFPLLRLVVRDVRLVVVLGIAGLLVVGVVALVLPQVMAVLAPALGRDVTLTGRTELWPVLLDMIRQRPLLGYGYSAFWSGGEGGLDISWRPTQAHNGYLEVALALGLIGFAVFVFLCVRGVTRALSFARRERTTAGFWPLLYFGFVLLYNLTEATTLGRNNIIWVLFVAALINVSPVWSSIRAAAVPRTGPARSHQTRVLAPLRGSFSPGTWRGGSMP
jgi:O-antigen ligase